MIRWRPFFKHVPAPQRDNFGIFQSKTNLTFSENFSKLQNICESEDLQKADCRGNFRWHQRSLIDLFDGQRHLLRRAYRG